MRAKSLCLLSMLVLGTQLTGLGMAAPKRGSPTSFAKLPVEELLNADGTLNLHTGLSGTLDLTGWRVTLDSRRGPILTRQEGAAVEVAEGSRREASPQPNGASSGSMPPTAWSALANQGLNSWVTVLAVMGSDLYVGGGFTKTADGNVTGLNYIAKYSGGTWSALADGGLNSVVYALAVSGSDLYVGGGFTKTADGNVTGLNYIAKYSGGTWYPLAHNGLMGTDVYALAVSGSDLYVGGDFWDTADYTVSGLYNIAEYSGGAWYPLAHNGLNGFVHALAVSWYGGLYVGGDFTGTQDAKIMGLNCIANYAHDAWYPLNYGGLDLAVIALAVMGSDLYVGGMFTQTADGTVTGLNHIAEYSGGAWYPLGSGLNSWVDTLAVSGSDLYVGGNFNQSLGGGTGLNYIAEYSGGAWSALPHSGLNNPVSGLAVSGSDLYVGGNLTKTFDGSVTGLNYIAELASYSLFLPLVLR